MARTLTILSSNSTRAVLAALLPEYESKTGTTVTVSVKTGKETVERIMAGDAGDAVILGSGVLKQFAEQGIVIDASRRPFARARVGVGVRRGFPKPDISSVEALRQSLLSARSIAHTVHGASGRYIPILFERLGIAEQMKAKTVTRPGGHIGPVVVAGEADIGLQQMSELLAVEGLEVVGFIPEPVQKVLEISSGTFTASKDVEASREMLDYLADPRHRDVYLARGLEQVAVEGVRHLRTDLRQ